jgi:hypothetical protein
MHLATLSETKTLPPNTGLRMKRPSLFVVEFLVARMTSLGAARRKIGRHHVI